MAFLLSRSGLRYNDNAIVLGAQTVRQGVVGPGRDLLVGETSPAAFSLRQTDLQSVRSNNPGFGKPS